MTGKRDEGSRRTNQVHFGTALFCRKKSGAEVGERNPMEQEENYRASPRHFLAAERIFLAWIWTGVALMALGFVLPGFGLFLHQFNLMRPDVHTASYGFSLWFGTVLILLGVVVCLLALVRYLRLLAMMRKGARSFGNVSALAVAVAVLLGILGLAMSYYLVSARRVSVLNHFNSQEVSMPAVPENGVVRTASRHPVEETVTKLQAMLQAKNVKLFAIVDHSGEAESAGMKMPNTKLLIFGNPRAGTPLMLAAPSVALDLPLKILVAEDNSGRVWISYTSPSYLQKRHRLPVELLPNIAVIEVVAANAAE
jgi:uncharacterized protein (DUF302 family)/uncharacterized membrane protein YidH (DUF202 family)